MASKNQSKAPKKRFTTRETILLSTLLVVALVYAYTNFFFLPTLDKISQLSIENETLQLEYDSRIALIAEKDELHKQVEENKRLYDEFKNQYFKTTNQEHFIKVIELDLLERNDLDITSLSFNETLPLVEFTSGEESVISLHSSIATFPFEGSYEGLIELIRRLEASKQLIRINSLDIFQVEPTAEVINGVVQQTQNRQEIIYQGNITIEFFIIPQDYSYPWNVGLPQYDEADSYEGSLFFYDDGGLVPPPTVVVDEDNQPATNEDDEDTEAGADDEDEDDDDTQAGADDDGVVDNEVGTRPSTYVVQPGDTLYGISMRFYGTNNYVDQIMFLNNISNTRLFKSGSTIRLPDLKK